ncbi:hypothetical protein MHH81_20535 [Psychrobacillus sp. FSL H8-0484]|uniref:hypothetical protein n=1 Tax=Psychrobacillus sp. FSL H8-0484 TaxID=2921390 RepID=UPI0030F6B3CC
MRIDSYNNKQEGFKSTAIENFRATREMRKQVRLEAKEYYKQAKDNEETVSWKTIFMTAGMFAVVLSFFALLTFSLSFLSIFS